MTLKRVTTSSGKTMVKMVECPYCKTPMDPQVAFRQHWPHCVANPEVST